MTHAIPGVLADILPDAWCDGSSRPADTLDCNAGSCTGAEWMTSEWSGVSWVRNMSAVDCRTAARRKQSGCVKVVIRDFIFSSFVMKLSFVIRACTSDLAVDLS